MIKRIVKLSFKENMGEFFLSSILPNQKLFTRNFKGCNHLELWQSTQSNDIIFSYSLWDSEELLNEYRNSEKFRSFWEETKQHFSTKAEAYSVKVIEIV